MYEVSKGQKAKKLKKIDSEGKNELWTWQHICLKDGLKHLIF